MSPLNHDQQLLARLCEERQELGWLEFKENLADPGQIGEYISALANSAVLSGTTHGYLQRPPSRNEALASFMTRVGISEERGSGWEKIATEVEMNQLPAPKISADSNHTKVTLYAPRPFAEMSRSERIDAVYLHTALRYVSGEPTTNASTRTRFGIAEQNSSQASRLLADTLDAGLILIEDPAAGPRSRRYVPFWAPDVS